MSWLRGLIIALGLILAAQIAHPRDIESYTDKNGTRHITNIGTKKRVSQDKGNDFRDSQCPPSFPAKSLDLQAAIKPTPEVQGLEPKAEAILTSPPPADPHPSTKLSQPVPRGVRPAILRTGGQDELGEESRFHSTSFRRVSWSSHSPTSPVPQGKIVSYRDHQGVIHIKNELSEEESPPGPAAPVAAVVHRQAVSPEAALPAVQEVSCPELGPEAVAYLKEKLQGPLMDLTGNAIHRYRDHRGVWRIFNQPPQEPQLSLPQMLSGARLAIPAAAHAPPPVGQPFPAVNGGQAFAGLPIRPSDPGVIARRDPRGILHVFNSAAPAFPRNKASPDFLGKVSPLLQACIIEAAQLYQLPVPLILALIRQESNFVHQAVSPKGAMGLMQLMPGTAALLGVQDPFDPRQNILAGCRYFRFLLDSFQGSIPLALAGYNAGHQRVVSAGCQVPAIKETQEFVTQVMGLYYLLEKHIAGL